MFSFFQVHLYNPLMEILYRQWYITHLIFLLPFPLETIYSMLINKDEKLQEYKYRTDPHNNNYSLPL